jgi:hypothetical protein
MTCLCFLFIVDGGVLLEGSCLICVFYFLWMVVSCRGFMSCLCFLFIVDGGVL